MMRTAGILIMGMAAAGSGILAAERERERLEVLCTFRRMVWYLKSQILYANASVPEALESVGSHFCREEHGGRTKPGEFFQSVSREMQNNRAQSLFEIWKREMKRIKGDIPFRDIDWDHLESLGEHLGYADRKMQEKTLMFYLEQTEEDIEELRHEVDRKGKLYRTLGLAAGSFLVIILL